MLFENHTPFAPFYFSNIDQTDREFHILVFRGTFDLVDGGAMRPCVDQEPIQERDIYYGEDRLRSSVCTESDIIPCKLNTDIQLVANAYAPDGIPAKMWGVKAKVGSVEKSLSIHGPRHWKKGLLGWSLSQAEKASIVPIRYELAYGGFWQQDEDQDYFTPNPVGRGFLSKKIKPDSNIIPAPQIEHPDRPIRSIHDASMPEGFGPIGKAWEPRYQLVGTTDKEWLEEDWPGLPWDFDFGFYNAAHPDLIYPGFMEGNEAVELYNLHPDGPIQTTLPGYRVGARINNKLVTKGILDTVILRPDQMKATLVWRATFRMGESIERIEARMAEQPESVT